MNVVDTHRRQNVSIGKPRPDRSRTPDRRRPNGIGGAATTGVGATGVGLAVLGAGSYGYLAIAARAIPGPSFASLSVVWTVLFTIGPGILLPIEQEVARRLAANRATEYRPNAMTSNPARMSALFAIGMTVVALAFSPLLVPHLLNGDRALFIAMLAADAALVPVYLSRGILAGTRRYRTYGLQLGLEGALRVLLAGLLLALGSHSAALFATVLCVAALAAAAATWPRRSSPEPTEPSEPGDDERPMGRAIGWMVCGTMAAQLLANGGPIVIRAIASPHNAVAGRFLTALVIARIPLFLFAAVQAVLLPGLARLHADRDRTAFVAGLKRLVLAVIAIGTVATAVLLIGGPELTGLFFGDVYRSSGATLAVLSIGCTTFLVAGVLAQSILAIRRPRSTAVGWLVGLTSFALLLLVPSDLVVRVSVALLVGSAAALAYFATFLFRNNSVDDVAWGAR